MIDFDTLDGEKLIDQASKQHADVCKASEQIASRYADISDLVKGKHVNMSTEHLERYKYPTVYLDPDRMEEIEDTHGNPVIHIWMECMDCTASGFIDIKDQEELHDNKQRPEPAKSQRTSGNRMGGRDISEKYC